MADADEKDAKQGANISVFIEQGSYPYEPDELKPGGRGKQGDQQEMGKERGTRRDKSHNTGDSDKLHEK
jgi:hypothetical protein